MKADEDISKLEQANILPPTKAAVSQKSTAHKLTTIWLLVILVVLLLGTTGIFAYKYYEIKQQVDNRETISSATPAKNVTVDPTPVASMAPTVVPDTEWKTYTNEIFTIKYPADWDFEIMVPMSVSTGPNTNTQLYSGSVKFSGPQGYFSITYGDGFGGAACFQRGGNLEAFTINQQNVNLCHRLLENNNHYWSGTGDSEIVSLDSSKKVTSYGFAAELNLSHSDSYSLLSQILATFKSP